jgi:hypothetical protein
LKIAYGSLGEVQNHLTDARERGYLDDRAFGMLWHQSVRASRATLGLLRFVRSSDAPVPQTPHRPPRKPST